MASKPPILASILFGEKELKLFIRWQYLQPSLAQDGYFSLPTAFEYQDYLHWRDHERRRYLPNNCLAFDDSPSSPLSKTESKYEGFSLAEKCGHPLHPAHPHAVGAQDRGGDMETGMEEEEGDTVIVEAVIHCPYCVLKAHLQLVVALSEKWKDNGGPWRRVNSSDTNGVLYSQSNRAYHRAKLGLINAVHQFEAWAKAEAAWEKANPKTNVEPVRAYSASRAVELYRKDITFPAHLIPDRTYKLIQTLEKRKQGGLVTPTPKQKRKELSFTPDTPEDTKHRPIPLFNRPGLYYDLDSPHKCPDEEGWCDTSFQCDYRYSISQCRILLIVNNPEKTYFTYRDLNAGPSKGDNPHVTRLLQLVDKWLGPMTPENRTAWLNYFAGTSDYFMVYKSDGEKGDDFDDFYTVDSLLGTGVEQFARSVGDVDEDEVATRASRQAVAASIVTTEEQVGADFYDAASFESDSQSDDEGYDELN